jgi:hypothetical protein
MIGESFFEKGLGGSCWMLQIVTLAYGVGPRMLVSAHLHRRHGYELRHDHNAALVD